MSRSPRAHKHVGLENKQEEKDPDADYLVPSLSAALLVPHPQHHSSSSFLGPLCPHWNPRSHCPHKPHTNTNTTSAIMEPMDAEEGRALIHILLDVLQTTLPYYDSQRNPNSALDKKLKNLDEALAYLVSRPKGTQGWRAREILPTSKYLQPATDQFTVLSAKIDRLKETIAQTQQEPSLKTVNEGTRGLRDDLALALPEILAASRERRERITEPISSRPIADWRFLVPMSWRVVALSGNQG
ncbi:uncharacterized protein F5Z01DRAFT_655399 [Emericellopsis atlantica]|uniref:Uncharacterized protein n=1 Tax=Emericellopsis atlantica TaxID=2614577 RepID=A0A9P7ZN11_9HYPO|nr:uncharacterized protein F5Z01DRAFT_655399 [Emericellopsis atlantica]KAG9254478.1 hypothetical protein F5Z01DRAFT_655399 [Emericellopsis atlantica]